MMETSSRIPEKLFFRIGEVCELIKVQPHVLRYWETEFPMLAPQKNRAGQRVYRRKDVEMVLRIRDLLYEEKFTIAGAKKKLMDELRGGSSRGKTASVEATQPEPSIASDETDIIPLSEPHEPAPDQSLTPQARRALRVIKRDLEDLLTLLNSNASIKS
jgi:DNA-binding transcriptional MerR regulator